MNPHDHEDTQEKARRLGESHREKLTRADFAAFELATGLELPHSLRQLYSDASLLLSTPGCFLPDFWIQCFAPLVPTTETFKFNGRTLMHLACGYDGEPILAELTGDASVVPLLVQWDESNESPCDIEDLEITLESLLQREWSPT